ncbi:MULTISPECIES: phosphoglycolate phosphatase [unclassified Methanoregula]|uniref:phosphoglycolate phosphatase n=1 Tax=unclassified Methanoregula TaxID=2649730 RepID=UPI0009CB1646|nr:MULTISPECIES: phosphoglycolate phosphatase [unclassified Methanoregula]OPX64898.1 MAG: Phosphoglycolate phosphatase [Methanoregula sp. PtaB.Bin085]OPY32950.1 MAG: Phosphoglycolate phosphatase [Methanoregula sp. PtaU1.Bin006]
MLKALLTDIDGTITTPDRRICTGSIELIRSLIDSGTEVVLASGNTPCFMDALCKMIGTKGTYIAENGGVFRIGYTGQPVIRGNQVVVRTALKTVQDHFSEQGIALDLYSPTYRFSDLAFARTVSADEVRSVLRDHPVQVIDTGYAIHLQVPGINKGTALVDLAGRMGLAPTDFLAIGDSVNDIQMLKTAGIGITVANAHPDTKAAAQYVAKKAYGDGFVEAVEKYSSYFRAR